MKMDFSKTADFESGNKKVFNWHFCHILTSITCFCLFLYILLIWICTVPTPTYKSGSVRNSAYRSGSGSEPSLRIWILPSIWIRIHTQPMDPDPYPAYGFSSIPIRYQYSLWIRIYTIPSLRIRIQTQPMDPDPGKWDWYGSRRIQNHIPC